VGEALRIRAAAIAGAAILTALVLTAPAYGAFGLSGLIAAPDDTQAGAAVNFHTHFDVDQPGDQLRDLTLALPPGLGANPQAVPKCTVASFNADTCDTTAPGSDVGTTTNNVTAGAITLDVDGTVYNLVPNPGEAARLGIVLRPDAGDKIFTQVAAELRPDDLGLNSVITDLPQQATLFGLPLGDISINSVDLTLSDRFMFNPTSCGQATTTFIARSWAMAPADPSVSGQASFTPTGCGNLPYAPTASLKVDTGSGFDTPEYPEVSTVVQQAPGEANTEHVELTLPLGLGPNTPVALGASCSQADFAARTCPAPTNVGTALAESPLLSAPLAGQVYIVNSGGSLPLIGIDLSGELNLQLLSSAAFVNNGSGANQLQSVLDGLPDLPLSKFTLTFHGGPSGLFTANTNVCLPSARLGGSFDSHAGQHVIRSVAPVVTHCGALGGGGGNSNKKARCGGRRATRVGNRKRNVLRGTRRRDVIAGLGGNDVIRGLGGNDILCGGKGRDRLIGGPGKDRLLGGPGRDRAIQ
jgi:hypothetical protein